MGYKEDQRLPSEIQPEEAPPPPYRPPLPPRDASEASPYSNDSKRPPPVPPRLPLESNEPEEPWEPEEPPLRLYARPTNLTWAEQDPRNVSTESLVPEFEAGTKRILLLIYVHGFVGDETSFQSFPAHIHNLATQLVAETHVVHTKIYPRYKSRRAINFVRDDFSAWLAPHESPETDVILVGHSMGGILCADVVLLSSSQRSLEHRILGSVNFDVPFLGMHPGVVASGLGSIFRPASPPPNGPSGQSNDSVLMPYSSQGGGHVSPATEHSASNLTLSPLATPINDPNYNPPFPNDNRVPVRKGWDNAMHFFNKHSDDLLHAAKTYVTSHLEFGGTMADYPKLYARYKQIRALEDANDLHKRRRFVNYYTASTGKIKARSPSPDRGRGLASQVNIEHSVQNLQVSDAEVQARSRSPSPIISIEGPEGQAIESKDPGGATSVLGARKLSTASSSAGSMNHLDPEPYEHHDEGAESSNVPPLEPSASLDAAPSSDLSKQTSSQPPLELPPLPGLPQEPADFDPSTYVDPDARKLAEKDHKRLVKAYDQAVKDRQKAKKERQKIIDKRDKSIRKEEEKAAKAERKAQEKNEKEKLKSEQAKSQSQSQQQSQPSGNVPTEGLTPSHSANRSVDSTDEIDTADISGGEDTRAVKAEKKKRDKKFCMLPKKGPDGQLDPTWVRVFMAGVDEVGAHCGLFFPENPHYEKLVNDVGEKIREWVEHDVEVRTYRGR